jgi:hypothetical protein
VFGKSLFELSRRLKLRFFRLSTSCTRSLVARSLSPFGFSLVEVLKDALRVCLHDIVRYAFHPENLNVEACAIWQGIVDR